MKEWREGRKLSKEERGEEFNLSGVGSREGGEGRKIRSGQVRWECKKCMSGGRRVTAVGGAQ